MYTLNGNKWHRERPCCAGYKEAGLLSLYCTDKGHARETILTRGAVMAGNMKTSVLAEQAIKSRAKKFCQAPAFAP
jgi:hypothetical protein